ncbi:hypothetical protein QSJ18_20050 [Gordonia sp. ABSL1-1]|uniref:hypothetical protein n=1 Tax=Gordonia sp. ABSL1-1 TaxID=3053923 RepID=UPI002573A900|nr:hypothetical protein [Gordonia sp. ABSL1-1]MDL9939040.1 hypothetical protein [Gordonia sp. ABSL1-1]
MRIEIITSARRHGIADDEIRTVIAYPALRVKLTPRLAGTAPFLHIGAAIEQGPHIEVIADLVDTDVAVVFHAMMLRPKLIASLGIAHLIEPNYGPQRG